MLEPQVSLNKDLRKVFLLILLSIIGAYNKMPFINTIFFLPILYSYYKSRNDVVYLALLFFLYDNPGGLFYGEFWTVLDLHIIRLNFLELFAVITIIKYQKQKFNIKNNPLIGAYKLYFYYLLVLVMFGLFYGMKVSGTVGTGLGPYFRTLKMLIVFSFYLSIPFILNKREKIIRFVEILFYFLFLNVIAQAFNLIFGLTFHEVLGGGFGDIRENIRPVYGMFSAFIMVPVLLFLGKSKQINSFMVVFGILFASITIIMSATRGWMIALFFILFNYVLFTNKVEIIKKIPYAIVVGVAVFFLVQIGPIQKQLIFTFQRFETLSLLLDGDETAGGTNTRLTDRSDPVMEKFYQKPYMGWGLSTTAFENYDIHVGNQSTLMAGGVIGLLVLLLSLYKIGIIAIKSQYKYGKYNKASKHLYIFVIGIMGFFIIHSSSTDLFSYILNTVGANVKRIALLATYFAIMSFYINEPKLMLAAKKKKKLEVVSRD